MKERDKNKVILTSQSLQSLLSACWYDLTQKKMDHLILNLFSLYFYKQSYWFESKIMNQKF